jgi:hypothetical protein
LWHSFGKLGIFIPNTPEKQLAPSGISFSH